MLTAMLLIWSPAQIYPNSHPTIAQQERQRKTRPSWREASSTSAPLQRMRQRRPLSLTSRFAPSRIGLVSSANPLTSSMGMNSISQPLAQPSARELFTSSISASNRHTMKTPLLVTLVGLAISFALPIFAQKQNTVDPEVRQQIEAVYMKFVEAQNKGDAAAIAALFTQDAVQVWYGLSEGGLASGQQAIEKRYRATFAAPSHIDSKIVQMYTIRND